MPAECSLNEAGEDGIVHVNYIEEVLLSDSDEEDKTLLELQNTNTSLGDSKESWIKFLIIILLQLTSCKPSLNKVLFSSWPFLFQRAVSVDWLQQFASDETRLANWVYYKNTAILTFQFGLF